MVLSGARGVARVVVHGNRPLTHARYPSSRFFASIPLSDSPPHFEWPHAAGCFRSHGRASSLHKAALSLAMVLDLTCVGVVVPISLLFCLNRPLRRPTSISLRPPPTRQKPARASGASEVKVTTRTSGMGHDEPHYKARRPGGLASRRIARSRVLGPVL